MAAFRGSVFGHREVERRWSSVVASACVTVVLFALAFASMTSAPRWQSAARRTAPDAPVLIRLPSPAPEPIVTPRVRAPRANDVVRANRREQSTTMSAATDLLQQKSDSVTASSSQTSASARDSAIGNATIAADVAPSSSAMNAASRALFAPSAAGIRDAIVAARERDSIAAMQDADAKRSAAYARAQEALERQDRDVGRRQAALLQRRATTAGNAAGVNIPMGDGVGGVGAVGGAIAHVGLSLFSNGPSAAQRKKNEAIDAENQEILRRLQARVRAKKDSIRADSVRADSVRRARVVPLPWAF